MIKGQLVIFEEKIADLFNAGRIPYPVHLSDGNELSLIRVFENISPDDWVCGTWRMHYQCLLKGVPEDVLTEAIMSGYSIALCFPDYRIISSGVVGGIAPIAVGIAMSIKRAGGAERVHCFLGDMSAETGVAHESMKYAAGHDLPIRWIIEDNGKSVCTDTKEAWGSDACPEIIRYHYKSSYPHAGGGVRVQF